MGGGVRSQGTSELCAEKGSACVPPSGPHNRRALASGKYLLTHDRVKSQVDIPFLHRVPVHSTACSYTGPDDLHNFYQILPE